MTVNTTPTTPTTNSGTIVKIGDPDLTGRTPRPGDWLMVVVGKVPGTPRGQYDEAWDVYAPTTGQAIKRVNDYLTAHPGEWVSDMRAVRAHARLKL